MPPKLIPLLIFGVLGTLGTVRAATVTLGAVADNYAQDADINGVFDVLATRYSPDFRLHTSFSQAPGSGIETGDVRSGVEFNISGVPQGATIISATFTIRGAGGFHNSDEDTGPYLGQSVSGYVGDGQITLSDFGNRNVVATSLLVDFDVTSFLQSLVNAGNGYAGFIVSQNTFGNGSEQFSSDWGSVGPQLVIQYSVPEPSSFALFSLVGVSALLRRRRSMP